MKTRSLVVTFSSLLLLSACASNNSSEDQNLSPAEKVLSHHGSNTVLTTAEGAIVGGAFGCGIGFLAGGTDGCIKGAIGGGVAGTVAGLYVASRAQAAKETEDQYASQIVQADKDAETAQRVADASKTVADEAVQKINALKVQLRNQQITVEQYSQQIAKYQKDRDILNENIAETQKKLESTNYLIAANRGSATQRQDLHNARQRLQLALKQQQQDAQSIQGLIATS